MPSEFVGISDINDNRAVVTAAGALTVTAAAGGSGGTVTQGPANTVGNAWPIILTDAVDTANIIVAPSAGGGNRLAVGSGSVTASSSLAAVTANTTGTMVDFGCARSDCTVIIVATGSPTAGTVTLELSIDNVTFVSSTATASITAAGNYAIFSTGRPARWARASLTGLVGSVTLTANIMGV
jgi:hypothetical protein